MIYEQFWTELQNLLLKFVANLVEKIEEARNWKRERAKLFREPNAMHWKF